MKYLLQVYLHKAWWEAQPLAARAAFAAARHAHAGALAARGHLLAAQSLEHRVTTLVYIQAGALCVTDGPFPTTQEYRIECYFIEARDFNHAIAVAAQMPQALGGVIEIVPLHEMPVSSL
jgi:hypothetical protein